jgi:hypothetical protein
MKNMKCPICGRVSNIHYLGKECLGCDLCHPFLKLNEGKKMNPTPALNDIEAVAEMLRENTDIDDAFKTTTIKLLMHAYNYLNQKEDK